MRPILTEAYDRAAEGAEYVVPEYREAAMTERGWRSCNLRTQFEWLIRRAGLTPWPRLFHALRSSCETELAREYPIHVVTKWLGNTPRVALKHYLMVRDDDFERAAGQVSGDRAAEGSETARANSGGNRIRTSGAKSGAAARRGPARRFAGFRGNL